MKEIVLSVVFAVTFLVGWPPQDGSAGSSPTDQAANTTSFQQDDTKEKPVEAAEEEEEEQTEDITQKVIDNNNRERFAGPPTEFRKGHVTPRKLNADSIKNNATGFEIQLPSAAPIPTITYYQGRIYCSGGFRSKEFYCFDADSGKLIWGVDLDDDGPSSAVCVDNVCVFNTESCTIFALDASSGEQLWSFWLGDPLMSTPTIANGKVFAAYPASGRIEGDGRPGGPPLNNDFNNVAPQQQAIAPPNQQLDAPQAVRQDGKGAPPDQTHVLACFELKTGKILWQRWIDSDVMSAPIADGDDIYATSFAGTVYRFRQSDGKVLSATQSRATSAPTIVNGEVNLSRRVDGENEDGVTEILGWYGKNAKANKKSVEFNRQTADYLNAQVQQKSELKDQSAELDASNGFAGGAPQAANPDAALSNIGQNNVSSLQAFQGSRGLHYRQRTYCCPGDKITCHDRNGKELWTIQLKGDLAKVGGMLAAPPIHAGGKILISTLAGDVLQLNPETGKVTATYKIGQPLRFPPIAQDGQIYVGTQSGKVVCIKTGDPSLTGWTTWGGNAAHNKTD